MDVVPLMPRPDVERYTRLANELVVGGGVEAAADAVVVGDEATLGSLLRADPELACARSARRHHATLLHYVAANGVEDFRQKSPPNAVAIATALLDAGAEVDALADTYGRGRRRRR